MSQHGRLSTLQAAMVVARRDFLAILWSRSFIFFLLGPLFTLGIGMLAGGIGQSVQQSTSRPVLGIIMPAADADALVARAKALEGKLDGVVPELVVLKRLKPGETADPLAALQTSKTNVAAVLSGDLGKPLLTGSEGWINNWQGRVALLAGSAASADPDAYPAIALAPIKRTGVDQARSRLVTAQIGQTVLFMLMMILAGMVLSNLVEEKGNKIIEVLAAAIPMDAVFLGKLFAMLGVSFVGIAVWFGVGTPMWLATGNSLSNFTAPAVGWPMFLGFGIVYFAMGYLVLGSLFLTIGSMASTVRKVQTLSMPVTMLQLINFFFANFAMAKPGTWLEMLAMAIPFSSPFTMLARAAQSPDLWPHALALLWQLMWVVLLVRGGALLFKRRVMMSGPNTGGAKKRWLFRRAAA
ncbi:ABC transporter permease [Novosphingobium sp.]|uniref:ABC transporter permease n=1 Tax=Novosphingobium sp. TaxID=1874826 RepID=UPI00286CB645|nr:ABC transporter permease [Novosphingobium sp.]